MKSTNINEGSKKKWTYRGVTGLLGEALFFQMRADDKNSTPEEIVIFTRSAVLQAVFAVEAAANALLSQITFSKTLDAQFERLQALQKFELYSVSLPNHSSFDYKCHEVKALIELIEYRNSQAHPKTKTRTVRNAENSLYDFVTDKEDEETWPLTGFPKYPRSITAKESFLALKTVDQFLIKFFTHFCKLSATDSSAFLTDRVSDGTNEFNMISDLFLNAIDAGIQKKGLKFSYLTWPDAETRRKGQIAAGQRATDKANQQPPR